MVFQFGDSIASRSLIGMIADQPDTPNRDHIK